ncbi:zinc finger protein 518A [Phyllopteryx taeniolatus]|uniref:zinc finger protein 518A n=1 Tax=Phyllopteryx taeniolatus TaxID=161469 RepID=UPI002AD598AE|nr:zinc finger protein 518A [Phyllopteryx taeniolatus]XP_061612223.1 zinc finger protein 518A [Phyllopteryx taeniolatus]XP_061612224.1 zinc finger protein 518A [Phyllopteryx taeniolatus]
MDEDLKVPHSSAISDSMSSVEDVKDSPQLKERERHGQGNTGISPVKQHGSIKRANCKIQQGAVFSGNILSFGCSVCKDDSMYSPNDLLKHFRGAHKGILPTYPCDLCGFVTNEFAALQRHRIEHKNTLVTCELCCDGNQYSLLLLTRHYIMCHSLNGKFHCDWCEFTTVDAGTFVQHIHHHNESPWKCSMCRHVSLNEVDHQKHLKAHTILLPFICQICGYRATTIKQLKRHTVAAHKKDKHPYNQQDHTNVWKTLKHGAAPTNSSSCQHVLKNISELEEAQKVSKLFGVYGILPNQNGQMKSEMYSEEPHPIIDGTPPKKDCANCNFWTAEQSSRVMLLDNDSCGSPNNPNALTVLMVKNKISLPPNCTTKVMGFKMVDGKKHLVLKVIPVVKQNMCPQDNLLVEDLDSSATSSGFLKSEVLVDNGESSANKSSTSHCFAVPPGSGSCIPSEDIMAVKVKIEEEETSVFTLESPLHCVDFGGKGGHSVTGSSTADTMYPVTNAGDPIGNQNSPSQTACSEINLIDSKSILDKSETVSKIGAKVSNVEADTFIDYPLNVSQEALQSNLTCKIFWDNSEALNERVITHTKEGKIIDERKETSLNSTENLDQLSQSTLESTENTGIKCVNEYKHCRKQLTNLAPPAEMVSSASFGESTTTAPSSLNHKVFTFHNYSKEAIGFSPRICKKSDGMPELTAGTEINSRSSNFSLTLAESSKPLEDGECADSDDENPESVLKDFNVIKIEEEFIPISKNQSDKKNTSSALGSFAEKHSDEIITQQLHKERTESSHSNIESSKQMETTVQLQVQDEKQQVVLKTEKTFAMPMQVKATPSFKLITNCVNPQINVSYMNSAFKTLGNPTGGRVPSKGKNTETSKARVNAKMTLVSSLTTGVSASPQHFLINSPKLKGPVLLSSASPNSPKDKVTKTQSTCYLFPRSIPFVQAPSSSGVKLQSAKLPLNSRPVLAMPVISADKPSNSQTGRQAFLLRYISPPKSSILLNNQEIKPSTQSLHTSEKRGNKVVFKIVSPTTSLLKSGSRSSSCQPLLLATSPPTQCFLMSSNTTNGNSSNNLKKIITRENQTQSAVRKSTPQLTVKIKPSEADKPQLAPRPIRPPSLRKLRRKALFDELPTTVHKARRLTNKVQTETDATVFWSPIAKDVERTLRLSPYNCLQQIKCPRRYQPVVVLNHPDADIPEVANIMKVINRHRGAVAKVSLSQKTIKALAEHGTLRGGILTEGLLLQSIEPSPRAVQSSVRERYLLKLKLRKMSKKKYEVVEPLSGSRPKTVVFDCWFCGRIFNSQEHWIGHGQRHLMEATKDWNKLL